NEDERKHEPLYSYKGIDLLDRYFKHQYYIAKIVAHGSGSLIILKRDFKKDFQYKEIRDYIRVPDLDRMKAAIRFAAILWFITQLPALCSELWGFYEWLEAIFM
ncbi:MAG: hypothetical protein VX278_15695, partial [Myxococcota bacterium]|nr:hypothetical protein [Myxococcota bacterium]